MTGPSPVDRGKPGSKARVLSDRTGIPLSVALYALVGGLHLVHPNEDLIDETIAALKPFDLRVIIPGHCTGWRAVNRFIAAFGETTVDPMAVGSRQSF